jgi:hypothetical protein
MGNRMRALQICLHIFLFAQFVAASNQERRESIWELNGKVTSEAGKPLEGVLINNGDIRTDENGCYRIPYSSFPRTGLIVRFRLPGYHTISKAVISSDIHQLDVVMKMGSNIWKPELCNASEDRKSRVGWHMKVSIPDGTKIERNSDIDSDSISIIYLSPKGYESMLIGTGPLWGGGVPPIHFFISHKEIQERELLAGERSAIDFRVIDMDGRGWREIGFFTESISYSNVSGQAAAFFDSIIDTMCWDPLRNED